jgi:hypothetical protein
VSFGGKHSSTASVGINPLKIERTRRRYSQLKIIVSGRRPLCPLTSRMIRRDAVGIDAAVRQHLATVNHSRPFLAQIGNAALSDVAV